MHHTWNPLTWGAESGGYFMVTLIVLIAVLVLAFHAMEKKQERREARVLSARRPYDRKNDRW